MRNNNPYLVWWMNFFLPYPYTIQSAQIRENKNKIKKKTWLSVQLCNYKHVGVCKFLRGNPFINPPRRSTPRRDSNFVETSRNKSSISHTNSLWWNRTGKPKKSRFPPIKKLIKVCCARLCIQQQVSEINAAFLNAKFSLSSIYGRKKEEGAFQSFYAAE